VRLGLADGASLTIARTAIEILVGLPGFKSNFTVFRVSPLGLADGHSTNLHGLTRKTVKFDLNPGSPTKISIAVRAMVTDAPYDFLVGNIILWTIGATLDAWREELRYRVDWLKGPSLANDREGRVSIVYTRDPGPPVLPAAQFCAPAWAVTTGGEEAEEEEDRSLPDLHDGTESEGGSQESEEEAVQEGTVERTPVELEVNQSWMLLPWEREWAPDAGRNLETGRMVLSSLPSREYRGPDYKNERGAPHIYALRRRFFTDVIELHVFRSIEAVVPPPGYEVVAQVERDAAGNWPRWAAPRSGGTSRCQKKAWGGDTIWARTHQPRERAVHGAGAAVPRRGGRRVQLHGCGGTAWRPARGPTRLRPPFRGAHCAVGRSCRKRGGAEPTDAAGALCA
jgi:hypothetical protein